MARSNVEHQQQCLVFATLAFNEAQYPFLVWIHASMNGASASSIQAAVQRKRAGQTKGIFDICIPFKSVSESSLVGWIEMKTRLNKLTKEQQEFREFALRQGHGTAVCYNADEALDYIELYCGIRLRGRSV